jgi:hypothetical protein
MNTQLESVKKVMEYITPMRDGKSVLRTIYGLDAWQLVDCLNILQFDMTKGAGHLDTEKKQFLLDCYEKHDNSFSKVLMRHAQNIVIRSLLNKSFTLC